MAITHQPGLAEEGDEDFVEDVEVQTEPFNNGRGTLVCVVVCVVLFLALVVLGILFGGKYFLPL